MKFFTTTFIIITAVLLISGCKGGSGKTSEGANETVQVPDTGFTGIKKYMSGGKVAMETTFRNGVKEGLTKTFYANGKLRGTMWYENGLREDSAKWYFEEGQLFRSTPYKRDTVDGIQLQYFRNGRLKARIGYRKGLRTLEFEEFDMNGKKIAGYPDLVVNTKDDYSSAGTYTINLSLSDKSTKVRYYRGGFADGVFDSTRCARINTVKGVGTLLLRKSAAPQSGSVDVEAVIITFYGNNFIVHKKIDLPYKDLN